MSLSAHPKVDSNGTDPNDHESVAVFMTNTVPGFNTCVDLWPQMQEQRYTIIGNKRCRRHWIIFKKFWNLTIVRLYSLLIWSCDQAFNTFSRLHRLERIFRVLKLNSTRNQFLNVNLSATYQAHSQFVIATPLPEAALHGDLVDT